MAMFDSEFWKMDMEPITTEERRLIKNLRESVSNLSLEGHFDTDIFYLKWLRARDLHLERAEEMLRKHFQWRKENKLDVPNTWEPEWLPISANYPIEVCGYNNCGNPILILPVAYWDMRKGVEAGLQQQMIHYIDQVLEITEEVIRRRSTPKHPVTQMDLILDFENMSFWQLASMKTIEMILEIIKRYEANHPEILHKAYVVNASRMFYVLFNLVKPFLSQRTMSKIFIYSSQRNEWQSALLENIEESQLPIYFGGSNETRLKMYQGVKSFIIPKSNNNFTSITINPEEEVLLKFDVTLPNTILRWEFKTDCYDIEFRVYRDGLGNDGNCTPVTRVPSWLLNIRGEMKCDSPGQYVAEFRNSHTKLEMARTLHYVIEVLPPLSRCVA